MLPKNSANYHQSLPPSEEEKTNAFLIILPKKYSFINSIKSQSAWLVIAILIQALIILFLIRDSKQSFLPGSRVQKTCENGMVFMYDLPPIFNKALLDKCHDLHPWKSRCAAVSNGGFGPKATNLGGVVPANLIPAWYWTDLYTGELIYHARMLNYECRTRNPNKATAFYVPFYAGLAIEKYLWLNYTWKDRDRPCEMVLDWLQDQPSWQKRNGADHFIMLGRLTWAFRRMTDKDSEWGSSFINMPLMKHVLKLTVERSPWDELEFSVPWPTGFHPRSKFDILEWQRFIRGRKRSSMFTFVGATRKNIKNDFRGLLMDYCKSRQTGLRPCKLVDCSVTECLDGAPAILEAFLDSDFCLQPRGDGYTRRSVIDCMVAGSIPVFFWEKSFKGQYEWHLPLNAEGYSVFIDHKNVTGGRVSIKEKLDSFSEVEIRKMRENVIDFLPRIVYGDSSSDSHHHEVNFGNVKDAFDITIERVLRKVLDLELRNEKSSMKEANK